MDDDCESIIVRIHLFSRPHSSKDVHHRDSLWWHMQAGGIVHFWSVCKCVGIKDVHHHEKNEEYLLEFVFTFRILFQRAWNATACQFGMHDICAQFYNDDFSYQRHSYVKKCVTKEPLRWRFKRAVLILNVVYEVSRVKKKNKANLRDLIAATGLVILLKLDSNRRIFQPMWPWNLMDDPEKQ